MGTPSETSDHDELARLRRRVAELEARLPESETLLRRAFDSPDAMRGVAEIEGDDILHVLDNETSAASSGRSVAETQGRWASELGVPLDERRLWIAHSQASRRLGKPVSFDFEQTVGGSDRWFTATVSCLGPGPGGRLRFSYVALDTTARRQLEIDLRRSERFLDAIVENIPDMVFVKEAGELRFVRFNRAGEELLGLSRDQLIGKNDHDFFPAEQADGFTSRDRAVLHSIEATDIPEERIQTRSRGERLLHTKKIAIRDESGRSRYLLGIAEDITDRRQVEEALRASEEKFAKAFRASPDAFIITRLSDGRIVDVNDALCALAEVGRESLLGNSTVQLRFWDRAEDRDAVVAALRESGRVCNMEYMFRATSGRRFDGLYSSEVIEIGGETHVFSVIRDISASKQAERELRRARDAAETANRAKDAFLANVSHEIRTPLNAILGFTQLVLDGEIDPETRERLEIVASRGEDLVAIISDILDFAKISAESVALIVAPFGPAEVATEVARALSLAAEKKGLALAVEVEAAVPAKVIGDAVRVRQILTNLVNNAIKFTEQGEVRIRVTVANQGQLPAGSVVPEGACTLSFAVIDTGAGIPLDKQARIFEPFVQADTSSTRQYGGVGLGLAICRRVASSMGGVVELQSQPGAGSTFRFIAPFMPAFDTRPTTLTTTLTTNSSSSVGLATGHILVVDDDSSSRLLVRLILGREGFTVVEAMSGKQAVEICASTDIHLVLLDLHMPEMSGIEACACIRDKFQERGRRAPPMVALTALPAPQAIPGFSAAGFVAVLDKPLARSALVDMVRNWVGK